MQTLDYSKLSTELQNLIGSTGNIKADTSTIREIFNRVLDDLSLYANWKFCVRRIDFDYLNAITEYNTENYLGLSDFKTPYELGGVGFVDDRSFFPNRNTVRKSANNYEGGGFRRHSQKMLDGEHYLLVNLNEGNNLRIDSFDNVDYDGEWVERGDANAPAQDLIEMRQGQASVKFRVDTSGGNNYAGLKNTTLIAKDLSDYEDAGVHLIEVYIPNAAVTGITIYFGSDSSNYWAISATSPINKSAITTGWNEFALSWEDATQVGSPDAENCDFFEVRCNYISGSFTDNSLFRFDNWRLSSIYRLDFDYFSSYMVIDSSGTWKARFTENTDYFAGDLDCSAVLVEMAFKELLRTTRRISQQDKTDATRKYNELRARMKHNYGVSIQKGAKKINIRR